MEEENVAGIDFHTYGGEEELPAISKLMEADLSEPYSIYTYRYFLNSWKELCFVARDTTTEEVIGAIVCKLGRQRQKQLRGYIAMLAVKEEHRKKRIGSSLVKRALNKMVEKNADEAVLETEVTNVGALRLYENLGFVRDKRLYKYYLNGGDAYRLKLWFK